MISRKPVRASASRLRILNGSLFDRLVADEEDIGHLSGMDVDGAQIASIKGNLGRVLNLRAGGAAANPGLGIIDMNDGAVRSNDMIRQIAESIRGCIVMGEPRIADVRVGYIAATDEPLSLRFRITACIGKAEAESSAEFDLCLNNDRRFILS
jgi:type VI secretion system lysozyme-like protein